MSHLLYLIFRCDGKFGKFVESQHSRRRGVAVAPSAGLCGDVRFYGNGKVCRAITLMAGVDLSPGAAPPVVPACLVGAAVACWGRLPAQTQSGVGLLDGELCDSPGQWMGSLLQIC